MASTSHSLDDPLAQALARVAQLEAELQASQRAVQTANQELQHFVYAASHDLQEPLRAITTYSQLLERMYASDPAASEFTAFIISGVIRMNSLLHNLLTYSRVNQSPVLQIIRVGAVLQATLFKLAGAIKESGAVIDCADLPEIPAHEGQLSHLFEQILSNSLLYRGPEKPEVEISAKEGELDGDPAQIIMIKDNGVGIEEQFLTQVIQPFRRLHGKEVPGNGLGLAICEKIMRAHKGRLWIESDGRSWTAVHLAFPY